MAKFDFDNAYFHGITACEDEKGFSKSNELRNLESILKHKAILSINEQKKAGIEVLARNYYGSNDSDYVSIFEKTSDSVFESVSFSFKNWMRMNLVVFLSDKILATADIKQDGCMSGETKVKGQIPSEYFVGIGIPNLGDSFNQLFKRLSDLFKTREKFKEYIEETFNYLVTPVREMLEKYGYNLKLYDVHQGEEILTAEEYVDLYFAYEQEAIDKPQVKSEFSK